MATGVASIAHGRTGIVTYTASNNAGDGFHDNHVHNVSYSLVAVDHEVTTFGMSASAPADRGHTQSIRGKMTMTGSFDTYADNTTQFDATDFTFAHNTETFPTISIDAGETRISSNIIPTSATETIDPNGVTVVSVSFRSQGTVTFASVV